MEFRSYQQEIFDRLKEGVNTCVQQDTGTGKSLIQINKALECVKMGQQVVIIVPRIELINNLVDYVKKLDPNIYSYHYCPVNNKLGRFQPNKRLYIGTYQSYQKVADRLDPDVIISDECHHLRAKTWESLIDQWSDAWHIGFTATPVRYDGKSLKKYLPKLLLGRSTEWYIDNGYLSDFDCYTDPDAVKFVSPKGLDELDKQQSLFDQNDLIGDAVKTWLKRAYGRKTIVFATGEDHAYHLEEQFNLRNGECARVITGKISQTLRDQYLYEFENSSKHPVLINIGILTEGVDTKNAEIVQLCRYTHSLSLYKQMVGRCLRPKKNGSKALILDHAGNISTHFEPDFPIDWEELYNHDENAVENFDRSTLMYCCGCCDRPLISLVELKGQQSIMCESCGYANIIKSLTSKQRRQLDIDESIELVEYKVPRHIQQLMKLQNDRKLKHNEKVNQILKVKAPRGDLLQTLINIGVSQSVADRFYLKNIS